MTMRSGSASILAIISSVVLLAEVVFSQGIGLTTGGLTLARNGLYIAGTDGLTAAMMNPAGVVYLNGRALEFSIFDRLEQHDYDSPTQGLFRSYREDNFSFAAGGYWKLSSHVAAVLAYGRPLDYQVNWPFAMAFTKGTSTTLLAFDMFNRIQIDAISPALAIRFGNLAFGMAANAYRVRQHTAFPLANGEWYQDRGAAAYQFEYQQDAWTYGFNLGLMATLSDKLRVGGMMHSAYDATLEGKATNQMLADLDTAATQVSLSANFEMPWAFGAGLVYQLGESWEINLDVAYSLWGNTQENLDFVFSDSKWQARLAQTDTVTGINASRFLLAFNNTIDAGWGIEYSPPQGLAYRAGYRYSQTPNSPATYNMLFPSVDQHWFAMGIGYKDGRFSIDASLAYAVGVSAVITAAENPHSPGKYDSNVVVPAVTLQYNF